MKYPSILIIGLLFATACNRSSSENTPAASEPSQTAEPATAPAPAATKEDVVAAYAEHVFKSYDACVDAAQSMDATIAELLAAPSAERLNAAREAWIAARRVYSPTEVFRFYGGPIDSAKDGVEGFLNAWPVDESYIDYVVGQPKAGIVHNRKSVPLISADVLQIINEKGGEANVSCGWHAIEFLLWGQDLDPAGPGARPHTDFELGKTPGGERRRDYLEAASALLITHLTQVRDAWTPNADNYRRAFESAPADESLQKILTGMTILFGFELSGERINVAYETGDQEDEHSCFSDTTHHDIADNAAGLFAVYNLLQPLAAQADPELATMLSQREQATRAAIAAIPVPFDQCVTADTPAARKPLLDAVNALEDHALGIAALAQGLGYTVPLRPE